MSNAVFDARTASSAEVEARLQRLTKLEWKICIPRPGSVTEIIRAPEHALGTQTGTTAATARKPAPSVAGDRFDARTASAAAAEARLAQLIGGGANAAATRRESSERCEHEPGRNEMRDDSGQSA